MMQNLVGRKFKRHPEVIRAVTRWLETQKTDLYQEGAASLVLRHGKCISSGKDYVEKQWCISGETVVYQWAYSKM
jgi:hypothetical protein